MLQHADKHTQRGLLSKRQISQLSGGYQLCSAAGPMTDPTQTHTSGSSFVASHQSELTFKGSVHLAGFTRALLHFFPPFFFPPVFNLGLGTNLGVHTDLLKCPIIAHSLESSGWKGFHRYFWHTLSLNHTRQWGDYSLLSPCLLELGSGWQEMDVSGEQSHSEKIEGGGRRVMPHKKSEDFLYCSTAEVGPDLFGSKSQGSTLAVTGIVVSQRNRAGYKRGYFYIAVYVRSRMSTCRELSSAPAIAHCQTRLIYIANLPLSIPRFPFSSPRLLSFSLSRRNPSLHVPMQVSIHLNERPSGLTACKHLSLTSSYNIVSTLTNSQKCTLHQSRGGKKCYEMISGFPGQAEDKGLWKPCEIH